MLGKLTPKTIIATGHYLVGWKSSVHWSLKGYLDQLKWELELGKKKTTNCDFHIWKGPRPLMLFLLVFSVFFLITATRCYHSQMLFRVNMIQTSLITEHGKLYAILLWYDSKRVNPYMAIDREGTLWTSL